MVDAAQASLESPRQQSPDATPTPQPAPSRSGRAATRYDQNAQLRTSLDRLDQRLASGEPLRRDVPPGYYLNVLV